MATSVAVMAHPDRAGMVDDLVGALGMEPAVIFDDRGDEWDTARRALAAYDPNATHHLVLQDDAWPAVGLVDVLDALADPDLCVSLYVGQVQPRKKAVAAAVDVARRAGVHWLEMPGPWWGVALLYPTRHIAGIIAAGDEADVAAYDQKVAGYYASRQRGCRYTFPSLVEHLPAASILAPGRPMRRAHHFIGDDPGARASDYDWTDRRALHVDAFGDAVDVHLGT